MNKPQDNNIQLCTLKRLREKRSLGINVTLAGGERAVFVVLDGDTVRGYIDRCPHRGTPLAWLPDNYLDSRGEHLICATHGALFRIGDGRCIAGPCQGDALEPIAIKISGDTVMLVEHLDG